VADDETFEPHLGRMRSRGGKRVRTYLQRVLAASNLARGGAVTFGARRTGFTGSRYGRAAGVGRVLARRDRLAAFRQRRVVIKASIVKLAGKGVSAAAAHLRYLQRDGTTRDGQAGALYGADTDEADARNFRARGVDDRHQFRFIVSPEDGAEYEDLKQLTRRLMAQVEQDLGTKLDWVAVDHFNTGHPHTHIVVRGVDDRGKDLVIARDYLTTGMRERAAELVDLDLGPRSTDEIQARLRQEVEAERLTSIDRQLLRSAGEERTASAASRDAFDQSVRAGRLGKLARLGLAEPLGQGRYLLDANLEDTLRRMGERGDIVRTMQREFSARALVRSASDYAIYDPADDQARPLTGRIVVRGLADEHADRHYLIVDGLDGRSHYVAIGRGESTEALPANSIVRVEPVRPAARQADRTVAEVAAANGGIYDIDAHLRHDPTATQGFAEAHVRRLEALRRGGGAVERSPSGQWTIAANHVEHAEAYERRQLAARPVRVDLLSSGGLEALVEADAATWLDQDLASGRAKPTRDAGFGRDVADARRRRAQWLVDQDLAGRTPDGVSLRPGALETLRRRELLRVASEVAGEVGKPFVEAGTGDRFSGIYRRQVETVSGRYALIERAHDFSLVPWRPVLERQIGKEISGIMRGRDVSWTFGRQRSGPEI